MATKPKKPEVNQVSTQGKVDRKKRLQELGWDLDATLDNPLTSKSRLDIPEELKKELQSFGLAARFINYRKYKEMGFNKADWRPYSFQSSDKKFPNIDSQGFYHTQDLVLAVKPIELQQAHIKAIREKTRRQEGIQEIQAEEMRKSIKDSGLDSHVETGYGED